MNQETELATPVTVAMNLLVNLQEPVRTMGSGLERHQLVKVNLLYNYSWYCMMCDSHAFIFISTVLQSSQST